MASSFSTTASASTAASPNNCDVFRGSDVKKTFNSDLYGRFPINGSRVSLDQQEGDNITPQIDGAIETASFYLAIFSSTYAQSSWCLDELFLILETLAKGATNIPVFYNVKPSQLMWNRGKNGPYVEALRNLENKNMEEGMLRYDSRSFEKWRNALSRLVDKIGFRLYSGDEGELLDEVVERVLKNIKKPGLEAANYPTGLDDKMKYFETTGLMQSGKPQILGIVG